MVADLTVLNQTLDLVLKLVLLGILIFIVIILRHLDKALRSAKLSANSVKQLSGRLSKALYAKTAFDIADMGVRYLWKRRKDKKNE